MQYDVLNLEEMKQKSNQISNETIMVCCFVKPYRKYQFIPASVLRWGLGSK